MSTIKEIYKFCQREINAGHGDFKLFQGYDCDEAYEVVNVSGAKVWDCVDKTLCLSTSYFNEAHSMYMGHDSFVDLSEEQYEKDSVSRQS